MVYPLACEPSPVSKNYKGADFALCSANTTLAGIEIEKVNRDPTLVVPEKKVLLVGLGCREQGGVDRNLGTLRVGEATVIQVVPNARATSATVKGAALCFGDAGGGTYVYVDPQRSVRTLVGVNSGGDMEKRSFVSILASKQFIEWATKWADQKGVGICWLSEPSNSCVSVNAPAAGASSTQSAPVVATSSAMEDLVYSADTRNAAERLTSTMQTASSQSDKATAVTRVTKVTAEEGDHVQDVVGRACGMVGQTYWSQLSAFYEQHGHDYRKETSIPKGTEFSVLPCPPSSSAPQYEEATVQVGDTVWKYFQTAMKATAAWADFRAPTPSSDPSRSPYFREVFQALNPGIDADSLPLGAKVKIPTLPAAAQETPPAIATQANAIDPIFAQTSGVTCVHSGDELTYPYDLSELLDVLVTDKALSPQNGRAATRVLIADTGLFGAGEGVFRGSTVLKLTPSWDDVRPLVTTGPEPTHGTEVASLALGGPIFARMQAMGAPKVQLVVQRIYRKYANANATWYGMEDQWFEKIMQTVRTGGVHIINLSFETSNEILSLKDDLNWKSENLFVVAAGNDDSRPIGLSGNKNVYPALYGGAGAPNLLAVAALQADGSLAPKSNTGPQSIEISAPGCDIPVISYDPQLHLQQARASGTSVAAPLVSFVAALIASERDSVSTPEDLKRRILVSADLNDKLRNDVADGRVLNVVKALALRQDAVDLKTDNRTILGKVTFSTGTQPLSDSDPLDLICGGRPASFKIRDILKIAPNFAPATDEPMKLYIQSNGTSLFDSVQCKLSNKIYTVVVHDDVRGGSKPYSLDEVKDIVQREYH